MQCEHVSGTCARHSPFNQYTFTEERMMRVTSGKLLTVAMATALCASALAEQKAHDPMSGGGSKDKIEAEMSLMDTSKDGQDLRDRARDGR
jgi:hypothetical protein